MAGGPIVVGVKVVLIVHSAPGARLESQVLVRVKSDEFAPVMAMLLISMTCLSMLVSVTVCERLMVPTSWRAKLRFVFESETIGARSITETVRSSCFDRLMLACVAHKQHAVIRVQAMQEFVHLFRACQARFI